MAFVNDKTASNTILEEVFRLRHLANEDQLFAESFRRSTTMEEAQNLARQRGIQLTGKIVWQQRATLFGGY
jgi:hypothetical protein